MKFCSKCGKALEENEKFCSKCGTPVSQNGEKGQFANAQDQGGFGGSNYTNAFGFSQNRGNYNDNDRIPVQLTDGEEVIRTYEVARALILPLRGYVAVTNKRVVLYSKGITTKFVQETSVSDAGSIYQSVGLCFKPKMLVIGLALLFSGIAISNIGFNFGFLTFGLIVAGLICGFFCIKPTNIISVKTGKAAGSGIEFGAISDSENTFSLLCSRRGADSDLLISELGSLIMDLQTLGDNAIQKWKK